MEPDETITPEEQEAPQAPEPPRQTPLDIGLRRPCSCGSGEKLKNCCFDRFEKNVVWVVYCPDTGQPAYTEHKDDEGVVVENTARLDVFDTCKQALIALDGNRQKFGTGVPLDICKIGLSDLEEILDDHCQRATAQVGSDFDIYVNASERHDDRETREAQGKPEQGETRLVPDPPYAALDPDAT